MTRITIRSVTYLLSGAFLGVCRPQWKCWISGFLKTEPNLTDLKIQTRKPSCRWQTRATLAKSLHRLRKSSGVVSCIASLLINSVPTSYLENGAFYAQSYYGTVIGNHMQAIDWCQFRWPWVTRPGFQGHGSFKRRISRKRCILRTKLL